MTAFYAMLQTVDGNISMKEAHLISISLPGFGMCGVCIAKTSGRTTNSNLKKNACMMTF